MPIIQIDMPIPANCGDCRFCSCEYTDDNKIDSYAYCSAAEKYIATACDGKDIVVATAITKKAAFCPLSAQETGVLDLDELFIYERLVYVEVKARADWPWTALVSYWYPDSTEIEDDEKDEEPDPYIVFVDSDADMYDFLIREYGVTWRCWGALPSRTEMKETPWKEVNETWHIF